MITSQNLNWIAGIVEGEGYIGWVGSEKRPVIAIDMTDRDIVERIAQFWKVKVVTLKLYKTYKQKYRVSVRGTKAASWLMTLFSLLGQRRQQKSLEVLEQWRIIRPKGPKPKSCP